MKVNQQVAPYPDELEELVDLLRYRQHLGWQVELIDDYQRDKPGRHKGESRGLTLVVTRCGPDSYNHEHLMRVAHYFAVPPATYNKESWRMWLFDRLGNVDTHERMEDFCFAVEGSLEMDRPYAPCHGPGWDPYLITVERTAVDRRTAYTGKVNDE